ncbi:hypothetical protein DSUL_20435 [Desulfovibrionales bacterium]
MKQRSGWLIILFNYAMARRLKAKVPLATVAVVLILARLCCFFLWSMS